MAWSISMDNDGNVTVVSDDVEFTLYWWEEMTPTTIKGEYDKMMAAHAAIVDDNIRSAVCYQDSEAEERTLLRNEELARILGDNG